MASAQPALPAVEGGAGAGACPAREAMTEEEASVLKLILLHVCDPGAVYELVPVTARTSCVRTFAVWSWRVGKRNLVGLCVLSIRKKLTSGLLWIFFLRLRDIFEHFS